MAAGQNALHQPVYFAQITDVHVGSHSLNPREAEWNLRWALDEIAGLQPRPQAILATADLVCGGTRAELEEFARIASASAVPIYALPANHDLWGEADASAWREIIGPQRQTVSLGTLTLILWDDIRRQPDGSWRAELADETREWLEDKLHSAVSAVAVAHHAPILPIGGDFHDVWAGSNAGQVLELFRDCGVVACITGHWHRCGEWTAGGVRVINTGPLCGWQWNGVPPHHCFPLRPGYRLFCWDGAELRTFWRDGAWWMAPAPAVQVTLESIGGAHTGGPRPQVRPPMVCQRAEVVAKAFCLGGQVQRVEISLQRGRWEPMKLRWRGLWSEWVAEIGADELRPPGPYVVAVRAMCDAGQAIDSVPVFIAERDSTPSATARALPGADQLFALFYPP